MGLDNPIHIAFVLIVVLLVFGAKRLPELGQSLGSGMRGFKDALTGAGPAPSLGDAASLTTASPLVAGQPISVAAEQEARPTA
jgi:sec-independent protein translocase protein TatA